MTVFFMAHYGLIRIRMQNRCPKRTECRGVERSPLRIAGHAASRKTGASVFGLRFIQAAGRDLQFASYAGCAGCGLRVARAGHPDIRTSVRKSGFSDVGARKLQGPDRKRHMRRPRKSANGSERICDFPERIFRIFHYLCKTVAIRHRPADKTDLREMRQTALAKTFRPERKRPAHGTDRYLQWNQ